MKVIFGIDVGGTNIKIGKFQEEGIIDKYSVKTIVSQDYKDLINQITSEISSHLGDDELVGIGIGIPGPVVNGVVLGAQNIKWEKVNLKEILSTIYPNVWIEVMNDANAATIGEWYFGTGTQKPNAVLITLGTGVGGGIIVNNKLLEGKDGSAGEIGHIKIFPFKGRDCSCGLYGCLEQYTSATGIARTARGMMRKRNTSLKKYYRRLNSKIVFDEAEKGDEVALEVTLKSAYYLAIGIVNICNVFNPDVVILGGGVSKAGPFFLDKVRNNFKDLAFFSLKDTPILSASLFNDAGIYGAYAKVKMNLFKTGGECNNGD